jgi:16S rRNA (cytidine1402-2'-O)-methyltransferase
MSKLYLVPTPIGNLEDMTFRAVEVLKKVSVILAEDTRTSQPLLSHYNISTPLVSHHLFNEHQSVDKIILAIKSRRRLSSYYRCWHSWHF